MKKAKGESGVSVSERELLPHLSNAQALIDTTRWKVAPEKSASGVGSYTGGMTFDKDISLTALVKNINPDDKLHSDAQLHTLRAIRRGVQMGFHLADEYRKRSGVASFDAAAGKLSQDQISEYNEKMQTAAAIAQFAAAQYVLWDMRALKENNSFVGNIGTSVDEINLATPTKALQCMIFYLARNVEQHVGNSDEKLVAVVSGFMEALEKEIIGRSGSFKHAGVFTDVTYQLEDSEFSISGFEAMVLFHESAEVKEVYPNEIIGNSEAVDELAKAMRKLFLYDVATQTNPIKDFGGFQSVILLSGLPGNGKTLLLSMARTLGRDYSRESGVPFQDLVVPNMVSKMQGESTDFARAYLKKLIDPRTINLGIADEIEAILPDHGGDDISEGDKKVAVEFLKTFSGVSSVDRLNFLFLGATNYPENIDKAFMSRVKSKHYVTGAETVNDYVRFLVLNLRKLNKRYPGIVNLKNADWNMDTTAPRVPDKDPIHVDPTWSVAKVREQALKMADPDDIYFFAYFFFMMKLRQKKFSLRDCANSIDGAKAHISGFEVPVEWVTQRQHYIDKLPEEKSGMIAELAREHIEKSRVNFAQMLDQKALYYAEELLRIEETRRERDVAAYLDKRIVTHLGEKAFMEKIGAGH